MNETTTEPGREVSTDKFSEQLARKEGEFALALPTDRMGRPMLTAGRFVRALITAVSMQPKLLRADRRSFWDASSRSALDGLLPDGKEAALVPFETRRKGPDGKWVSVLIVQYIPMIGGYRRLVRESGIDWQLRVVHRDDQFEYVLGDEERIVHVPSDHEDPGPWTAVYAIAKRGGDIIARDVMNRAAVFRIRDRSQGWQSMMRIADEADREKAISKSAWHVWEEEMALKTVAKKQVKVLPLSTDSLIYDVLRREDQDERGDDTIRPAIASAGSLSDKMRALADQREEEALEDDGDNGVDDIDQDGDVIDKQTGEITKPAATTQPDAAAAPGAQASTSSSQKAVEPAASGATNATAADTTQRVSEPKAPDAPTVDTAPAASDTAGAGSALKLTTEQAAKVRKLADALMGAQSERTITKGTVNFLEDESYPEGSAAENAVVAIRDAHIARVRGKGSPAECDMVRDRVTRL